MQWNIQLLREHWDKLSRFQKIGVGSAVASVFLGLLLLALLSSAEYSPLFTDLAPDDAASVLGVLQDSGVPYEIADQGATILVPQDQVYELRMNLASQGLPAGGVVGFEIFSSPRLGETEADRRLRVLWALQGELTRTIREIDVVDDARVHIVMPERSLFLQESSPSTASVMLQLRAGTRLSQAQVAGIGHLVSTGVEGLNPENVTIVDSSGNVLSGIALEDTLDGDRIRERLQIEEAFARASEQSVVAMLERVYGRGNVVARVSADLEFDLHRTYSETFEPITRDSGLPRSSQSLTESYQGGSADPGGIPGVESNVPGYVGLTDGGEFEYAREETIINYEMNRIEHTHTGTPGQLNRLSISVVINEELTPAQLLAVEETVAGALGIRPDRGDQVHVLGVPFEMGLFPEEITEPMPEWAVPTWVYILIVLLLLAALVVIRRRRQPSELGEHLDVSLGDEETEPEQEPEESLSPEERERAELLRRIRERAEEKPDDFAQLLRTWLTEE